MYITFFIIERKISLYILVFLCHDGRLAVGVVVDPRVHLRGPARGSPGYRRACVQR